METGASVPFRISHVKDARAEQAALVLLALTGDS